MNGSCQTTSDEIDFSACSRLVGIVERESGTPEEFFDDSLLEVRRILDHLCFEALDHVIRVVERAADGCLCAIHEAVKAIGRLLPVIGANDATITLIERRGDEVNVAVEKIDALAPYREPCAAIDPGSPPSQV